MKAREFRLSKSKVMAGRQCTRRLWLETHRRDLMQTSQASQMAFDNGHLFGDVARTLMGTGHLIGHVDNIGMALKETTGLLPSAKLLFEPAFSHHGVVSRADGFERMHGGWHMIEAKASTRVKDYYLEDCAVQAWVANGAGATVKKISLAYISRDFVYQGDNDYRALMVREDVTDQVFVHVPQVSRWVTELREVLHGSEPVLRVGAHCSSPYECPFSGHCQSNEPRPPKHPVDLLPRSAALVAKMAARGITDLRKVPDEELKTDLYRRIRQAHATGKPVIAPGVGKKFKGLGWPRYFLDFETIAFSVPVWKGTRPYQQVPFQWSCHVQARNGTVSHREFLDTSGGRPVDGFTTALVEALGTEGPVFVYNQAFEEARLRELAEMLPKKRKALLAIVARLVDLLPVTREHYYHPDMRGSFSIKSVLPTIAPDLDYSRLEHVQDGGMAQQAWTEITHPDTKEQRKTALRLALLAYCKRDTLAMIRLARFLQQS